MHADKQTHPTEGLPQRVDQPFLNRWVSPSFQVHLAHLSTLMEIPGDVPPKSFETKSGLEIKIALGNYRMFFTPGTEDYFHRYTKDISAESSEAEAAERDRKKLDDFVSAKLGLNEMDVDPAVAPAATAAPIG